MNNSIKFASPTFLFHEGQLGGILDVIPYLAGCGFDGFELYGLFGESAKNIKRVCDEHSIVVMGDHVPYPEIVGDTKNVIKDRLTLGMKFVTVEKIPEDHLPGQPYFSDMVKDITRVAKECKEAGLQLLYHNHGHDLMTKVDGKYVLEGILDAFDPELLKFQHDLGWMQLGGGDPAYFLEKYKDRSPVIHLKDFYCVAPMRLTHAGALGFKRGGPEYEYFEFRPTGYGIVNFPKYMPAVFACNPEWLVADHDLSYERDTIVDLTDSLNYVKKLVTLYPDLYKA